MPLNSTVVEIVAPIVTPPIDYHLNPVFDYSFFWGWPIWVWVFIIIGIVLLAVWLRWLRKKMILSPVVEYLSAYKSGLLEDMQTWILGKNKSFFIKHLRYHDDGIISYPKFLKKISMWYLGSSMAVGHAGGIKSVMVSDNYDTVRDAVAEIGLNWLIDSYNNARKEPAKDSQGAIMLDENGDTVMRYPISNYDDYEAHRKDIEQMFPMGAKVASFVYFNVLKSQQFMPPNRTAGMMGADCIREARKKNIDTKEASPWLKFAPLGVALVVVILSMLLTYMYTTGGK